MTNNAKVGTTKADEEWSEWIQNHGTHPAQETVQVKFKGGDIDEYHASAYHWEIYNDDCDIIAYRYRLDDNKEIRIDKDLETVPGETLPPVGAFVDVTGDVQYGSGETNCEVVAHVEDCAVIRMSYGLGCFESRALSPAKNERERVIQVAMQAGMRDGGYHLPVEFCEALYDAGMLVMPNKE